MGLEMKPLSNAALERLREGADSPDLTGTRYRLLERIARGGMGVVYAAQDENLQRRVALKVLDIPGTDGDLANRLIREARVLAALEHPGIVPVHDVGTLADGRVFYTMKFVEGQRLDEFITTVKSVPDRLRLFLRICDAVGFAHAQGVLHRDLKPANVMVGPFGEVLVMDWGLAKILRGADSNAAHETDPQATVFETRQPVAFQSDATEISVITGHGTVMGTPGYMSPEQARGDVSNLDARSDIFSLGALLRFLLTGKPELSPDSNAPRLDKSLAAICTKATAATPAARYSNVSDLAQDVSKHLDGLAVGAHRESILEKTVRFYRRYRFFILLIAAYLFMRIILLLFSRR
jgi:eukaryotic-like serine/threonine-protein kinase